MVNTTVKKISNTTNNWLYVRNSYTAKLKNDRDLYHYITLEYLVPGKSLSVELYDVWYEHQRSVSYYNNYEIVYSIILPS